MHLEVEGGERRYYQAGGFGPEPENYWLEDEDKVFRECEHAKAAYMD